MEHFTRLPATVAWLLAFLLLLCPAVTYSEDPRPLTNSLGMRFAKISAGSFRMGATDGGDFDEQPAHTARISRDFFLGVYEITQADWQTVMGENPSWFSPTGPARADVGKRDTRCHPVDHVTWHEAVGFCRRLSDLPAEKQAGRTYRLPTEAEWEFACRAGTTTTFSTGHELSPRHACFATTEPKPVGSFPPNAWGLFDMHGNVWEWCADWYDPGYFVRSPAADPTGPPEGTGKVIRGGAWNSTATYCRSSNRDFTRATRRDIGNGLRVVCVPIGAL
ncbi:MAG: formylglycine-generating enzyme family protein [Planctomycetales bacterium]|nr:formylglycine-generating enzyme family protein [Planctomycetales bacterium]